MVGLARCEADGPHAVERLDIMASDAFLARLVGKEAPFAIPQMLTDTRSIQIVVGPGEINHVLVPYRP